VWRKMKVFINPSIRRKASLGCLFPSSFCDADVTVILPSLVTEQLGFSSRP
jgi:hypothetical protein